MGAAVIAKSPSKPSAAQEVTDYQPICKILVENKDQYISPAIRDKASVPAGALQRVLIASDSHVPNPSNALEALVDEK